MQGSRLSGQIRKTSRPHTVDEIDDTRRSKCLKLEVLVQQASRLENDVEGVRSDLERGTSVLQNTCEGGYIELEHSFPHDYKASMSINKATKDLLKIYQVASFATPIQPTSSSHRAKKRAQTEGKVDKQFINVRYETQPTAQLAVGQAQRTAQLAVGQAQPTAQLAVGQAQPTAQLVVGQAQPTAQLAVGQAQQTVQLAVGQAQQTAQVAVGQAQKHDLQCEVNVLSVCDGIIRKQEKYMWFVQIWRNDEMFTTTYVNPEKFVSRPMTLAPQCDFFRCTQTSAVRLVLSGQERCACSKHATLVLYTADTRHEDYSKLTALIHRIALFHVGDDTALSACDAYRHRIINPDDIDILEDKIDKAAKWNYLNNTHELSRLCMVYRSTIRLMQGYSNFCDFVCRKDQEGWAAVVACITCILVHDVSDVCDVQLHEYIRALADTCTVSVLFSEEITNKEQSTLVKSARYLFAAGSNRVRVWCTEICSSVVVGTNNEIPNLDIWAQLAWKEAVRITSVVMTTDTANRQQAVITKVRQSVQAVANAFLNVTPENAVNEEPLSFMATFQKAEKEIHRGGTYKQQLSYISSIPVTTDDCGFDSEDEMEKLQLHLERIADILRSIHMLVCEKCLCFVMAPASARRGLPKRTLCRECSKLPTGKKMQPSDFDTYVETESFDDVANMAHMALGAFVSLARRLMQPQKDRACWASMSTFIYGMGPLVNEDPQFGYEPMGDMSAFEAKCDGVDLMPFDRGIVAAVGSGPVHIKCLDSLMRFMQRIVDSIVITGHFQKTQPILSLTMSWIRIITAENKALPLRVLKQGEQDKFAQGGYSSSVNCCFDYGKSKDKHRLANKWVTDYAAPFIGVILRAVHEWSNGNYEIADILAVMAVNIQVPGTKNGKGDKLTIDWKARQLGPELARALADISQCKVDNKIVTIFDFDKVVNAFNMDRKGKSSECDLAYVCPTLRIMVLQQLFQLVSPSKISNEAYQWLKLATNPKQSAVTLFDAKGSPFCQNTNKPDRAPRTRPITGVDNHTKQVENADSSEIAGSNSPIYDDLDEDISEEAVIISLQ